MELKIRSGFTLLELLIVIAIIGIIVSIVLASVTESRKKAHDAAIQEMAHNARTTVHLFHGSNQQSFAGACTAADGDNSGGYTGTHDDKVAEFITAIDNEHPSANSAYCYSDVDDWAMESELNQGGFYCVDARDNAVVSPTSVINNPPGDIDCD